ncbi:MAG: PPOX class F420-dependent oxidoreductase [Pseudomonadales bacterium]
MQKTLNEYPYISLATLKRDSSWVWTPIWFARLPASARYVAFSAGNAGKVKRLRNFASVQVRPCTATGRPLGDALPGSAALVSDVDACDAAHQAICSKYGWQMHLLNFFSKLSGNYQRRQWIEFQLTGDL